MVFADFKAFDSADSGVSVNFGKDLRTFIVSRVALGFANIRHLFHSGTAEVARELGVGLEDRPGFDV